LVISQIIGYALSKYIGIKVCSEIKREKRALMLVTMIFIALVSLVFYGLVNDQWKFVAIFFSGLPLGMVWGLVVWYLEGRTVSEILLAGLSCSFILASGVVKDVGRYLMAQDYSLMGWEFQLSEGWMPAATGAVFLIPFLLSVWLLNQIPRPSQEDELARTHREPMDGTQRLAFVKSFFWGLLMLSVAYFFLTAYRDYRDNYQVELFNALDYPYDGGEIQVDGSDGSEQTFYYDKSTEIQAASGSAEISSIVGKSAVIQWSSRSDRKYAVIIKVGDDSQPSASEFIGTVTEADANETIISKAERIVAFGVLVPLGLLFLIRNNRYGLIGAYVIMTTGMVLLGASTWALQAGKIDGFWWMVLAGMGAYLTYVPFGSVLFDRLIATTRFIGTAVFAIYVMDALGYTGSVAAQIYVDFIYDEKSVVKALDADAIHLDFMINFSYMMAITGAIMMVGSLIYFLAKSRQAADVDQATG
ncbi:MAG: DUF5690 family protein, partial [Planctomycetales bacterium]